MVDVLYVQKDKHDSELEELKTQISALKKSMRWNRDTMFEMHKTYRFIGLLCTGTILGLFFLCFMPFVWISWKDDRRINVHSDQIQRLTRLHTRLTTDLKHLRFRILREYKERIRDMEELAEHWKVTTTTTSFNKPPLVCSSPKTTKKSTSTIVNSQNCTKWRKWRNGSMKSLIKNHTQFCEFVKCIQFIKPSFPISPIRLGYLKNFCHLVERNNSSSDEEQHWMPFYDLYRPVVVVFYVFLGFFILICKGICNYISSEIERAFKEALLFLSSLEWILQ